MLPVSNWLKELRHPRQEVRLEKSDGGSARSSVITSLQGDQSCEQDLHDHRSHRDQQTSFTLRPSSRRIPLPPNASLNSSQPTGDAQKIGELRYIEPVHVATYVETLQKRLAAPSVKVHLAAVKMLSDWLVIGQVIAINPAAVVRGPKHSVKEDSTPVVSTEDTRRLLNSIDVSTWMGLRDRALIVSMTYTRQKHQSAEHPKRGQRSDSLCS
ncbi:hypothetical protein [Caballeronia glebae]|uniref:hypothetical protein n=1 Tax=Caballeronia glebae TaxID=1777143 RepID=UPI0038BA2D74